MQKLDYKHYLKINAQENENHDVYLVDVNKLFYNHLNGRINHEIHQRIQFQDSSKEFENPAVQKAARESFQDIFDNDPTYKKVMQSILDHGQKVPIVLTPEFVIVDGNSRTFLIRKLIEEGKLNDYKIKAIILNKNYRGIELEQIESLIQYQHDSKTSYSQINKKLKFQQMLNHYENDGMLRKDAIKKISQLTGERFSIVKRDLEVFNYTQEVNKKHKFNPSIKILSASNGHYEHLYAAQKFLRNNNQELLIDDLEKTALHQIENQASLIRSFREIMPGSQAKAEWLKDETLFKKWCQESINASGKEKMDFININILHKIKTKRNEKKKILMESNIIKSTKNNQEKIDINLNIDETFWALDTSVNQIYNDLENLYNSKDQIPSDLIDKLKTIAEKLL